MTSGRWARLAELFEECRDKPPGEREAILRERCGEDDQIRREVLDLLDAHDRDDGLLHSAGFARLREAESVGDDLRRLGRYTVHERIGSGGMGIVYRAEQGAPRRDVALKVLPMWLQSRSARARFGHEAEALARLDHPHIARIYDADSAQDDRGVERTYFAMELVRGRPLTVAAGDLSIPARLSLMESVCRAVHYAHQRGVIHRDLKPSNILVDADNEPRVLDFGVARVIDAERPAETLHQTQTGHILGTVAYMSPEQASGDPSRLDTRADVYALGVLLYECLAGRLPIDIDGKTLLSSLRAIAETAPLPLPDLRTPLQRDLQTIVNKAMAKEQEMRYESAAALADDLARARRNEPILAHPPTTSYVLRKFVARHRPLVALGGVAALALAVGAGALAIGLTRARAAEAVALERLVESEREADKARAVREVLRNILVSANPENTTDRDITVREVLDVATTDLLDAEAEQPPEVLGAALWTIGSTYRALGETEPAARTLEAAVETLRPTDDVPEFVDALSALAGLRINQNEHAEAESLYREALAKVRSDPDAFDREPLILDGLGIALQGQGRTADAIEMFLAATPLHRAHYGEMSLEMATNLNNIGFAQFHLQEFDNAAETFESVLAVQTQLVEESHPQVLRTLNNLGAVYGTLGRLRDALEVQQRALELRIERQGPDHPDIFYSRYGIGGVLVDLGEDEQALDQFRLAISIVEDDWGPTHPLISRAVREMALTLRRLGRYEEAWRAYRRAFDIDHANDDHRRAARALEDAAFVRQSQGLLDLAHAALDEAEAYAAESLPGDAEIEASILLARGMLHVLREDFEKAVETLRSAVVLRREAFGDTHPRVGEALSRLGDALVSLDRASEAEQALVEAEAILLEALGGSHWLVGETRATLGMACVRLGRITEGVDLINAAWPLIENDAGPARLARVADAMTEAFETLGDTDAAARWGERRDILLVDEQSSTDGRGP